MKNKKFILLAVLVGASFLILMMPIVTIKVNLYFIEQTMKVNVFQLKDMLSFELTDSFSSGSSASSDLSYIFGDLNEIKEFAFILKIVKLVCWLIILIPFIGALLLAISYFSKNEKTKQTSEMLCTLILPISCILNFALGFSFLLLLKGLDKELGLGDMMKVDILLNVVMLIAGIASIIITRKMLKKFKDEQAGQEEIIYSE